MADIYFKKQHWIGGEYWQLYRVRSVEPEKRSRLSLVCQEYLAVSGDIGDSSERVEQALGELRDSMKADGHQLHFEETTEESSVRQIIQHVLENDDDDFKDIALPHKEPHRHFTDADLDTGGSYPTIYAERSELIHLPLPWQKRGLQQTSSGYGGKLTSEYCILFNGKTRRLYVTCYGNACSHWFMAKDRKIFVN